MNLVNSSRTQKHWNQDHERKSEHGMIWENSIETCILSRVKQITSPGWMHEPSAQTWCTGKTQRDGMGREVGGGIGMGNTCKSMADSFQCMTKPSTIKEKKKKNIGVGCHALLQGIFPTQGSNPGLPHCRWILYQLRYQGTQCYGNNFNMFFYTIC